MKYLCALSLLILFSSPANALCFDLSVIAEGASIGICGDHVEKTPITVLFIFWLLINVTLGQTLLLPKVHLSIKYTLFVFGLPLSPIVVVTTLLAMTISRRFGSTNRSEREQQERFEVNQISVDIATDGQISGASALSANVFKIGDFTFNKSEQSLVKGDQLNVLEPKCMQVLSYLIEQQPRIVSLEELHNNVWENQIVTDTAVRRVISKLRQAFADNDTKNPQYIKSIMKRGYQLISEVNPQIIEK